MSLACNCKPCQEQTNNPWKCEKHNVWIYKVLPDGMRPATEQDFAIDHRPYYGKKYLAKSFVSELFQACRYSKNTDLSDLKTFIDTNRVFVKIQ